MPEGRDPGVSSLEGLSRSAPKLLTELPKPHGYDPSWIIADMGLPLPSKTSRWSLIERAMEMKSQVVKDGSWS